MAATYTATVRLRHPEGRERDVFEHADTLPLVLALARTAIHYYLDQGIAAKLESVTSLCPACGKEPRPSCRACGGAGRTTYKV